VKIARYELVERLIDLRPPERLVKQALHLLRPVDRAACVEDINKAFLEVGGAEAMFVTGLPKEVRRAFQVRLRAAENFQAKQQQTTRVLQRYLRFGPKHMATPLVPYESLLGPQPDLSNYIHVLTHMINSRSAGRPGPALKAAKDEACKLLRKYRGNARNWRKLAAILYGKPGHSMDRALQLRKGQK
jgi:hypothetical protein